MYNYRYVLLINRNAHWLIIPYNLTAVIKYLHSLLEQNAYKGEGKMLTRRFAPRRNIKTTAGCVPTAKRKKTSHKTTAKGKRKPQLSSLQPSLDSSDYDEE